MRDEQDFKDEFVKDVVKKGRRTISNKDFDSQTMKKVYARIEYNKETASKIKQSILYFYLALSLLVIYTFCTILFDLAFNDMVSLTPVLALFFGISIGITFLGNYKKLIQSF